MVMKQFKLALALSLMAGVAGAQVFDSTSVTDNFTSGTRGNGLNYDTDGSGPGLPAGSSYATNTMGLEYTLYDGADANVAIKYINTYAADASGGDAANGESPIVDATLPVLQPDNGVTMDTMTDAVDVTPNTRPGAASPNNVIVVSDDGGQNSLIIGDDTSADYFIEVDVFCPDRSTLAPPNFEAVQVALRACRNDPAPTSAALNVDREPSYFMYYDYQLREIRCVKSLDGISSAASTGRGGAGVAFDVQYGTTVSSVTAGWHTFRIEANDAHIIYSLDGAVIADVVDATPIGSGRAVLAFREGGVASADEAAGVFDNLKLGPATISAVNDWAIYR